MRSLNVFNNISLDGFISDARGDMSWAHQQDPEWLAFTKENVSGGDSAFLFGRVTYEMMASYWPTPGALRTLPEVAAKMNGSQKIVCSRTLTQPGWQNTRLLQGDLVTEVRKLKQQSGPGLLIMGSASIVAQLSQARLIDSYQLVLHPLVLGGGKSLFSGLTEPLNLKLTRSRAFGNGRVVLWYDSARGASVASQ
jgi:dihydrofolate reductase